MNGATPGAPRRPLDPERLHALRIPEVRQTYGWRETVIYALGIGLGLDPVDERQLAFVDETKLEAFPTMASVLARPGFWIRELDTGLDWVRAVHAEQSIRLHRPIPPQGEVFGTTRILEIVDKGPGTGALIRYGRDVIDAGSGQSVATIVQTTLCRGDGGFGGSKNSAYPSHPPPERSPDLTVDMPTYPQMALVYRLSGDLNPLHCNPAVARKAGYDQPLLHGLATYGVAAHALVASLCDYEPARMRGIDARFSAPAFPGDHIAVDIWKLTQGEAAFRARVPARNSVVLTNGRFVYE